jgi:hypothetical protein
MVNRSRTRIDNFHLADVRPQDRIAPNFRIYELNRSDLAQRLDIDNRLPDDGVLRAAVHLTREVMQPIRDAHGRFSPTSVYRSQELERFLKKRPRGWISVSPHTQGCACDLDIPGLGTLALAQWTAEHLPDYDEIICERFDPRQGPNSGWVHIALRPLGQGVNRRRLQSEILDTKTGHWVLVPGLTDTLD